MKVTIYSEQTACTNFKYDLNRNNNRTHILFILYKKVVFYSNVISNFIDILHVERYWLHSSSRSMREKHFPVLMNRAVKPYFIYVSFI